MDWSCSNCQNLVHYLLRICNGCGLRRYPAPEQLERARRAAGHT